VTCSDVVRMLQVPIAVVNTEGAIEAASEGLRDLLVGDEMSLTGRRAEELLALLPDLPAGAGRELARVLSHEVKEARGGPWRLRRMTDGTALLERERALLARPETSLRQLVAAIPEPVAFVEDGRLTPNEALLELLGYAPEEIGTTRDWFARVHPEDATGAAERYASPCAAAGVEIGAHAEDGHVRRLRLRRRAEGNGRELWFLRDISSEVRLSHLLSLEEEGSRSGGWELDTRSMRLHCTPELLRVLELTPEQRIPHLPGLLDFFWGEHRARVARAILTAIDDGQPFRIEAEVMTAQRRRRWVRVEVKVDSTVGSAAMYGTLRDLSVIRAQQGRMAELSEKLLLTTRAARIGIWEWEVTTGTLRWDRSMLELHDLTTEAFFGRHEEWLRRIHEADRERVLALFKGTAEQGRVFDTQFRIQRPDGSLRVLRSYGVLQTDDGLARVLGVSWDVTETDRALRRAQRSESLARATLDAMPMEVALLDGDGTVRMINGRWRAFGAANGAPQELSAPGFNYLPALEQAARDGVVEAKDMLRLLDDVRGGRSDYGRLEYPCDSPSEHRDYVAHVVAVDDEGERRLLVAHENVTVLQDALRALDRTERRFQELAKRIDDAFWVLTPSGRFEYLSPAFTRIWGESVETEGELLARVDGRDRERVADAMTAQRSKPTEVEFRIHRPDGQMRWVHSKGYPMLRIDGSLRGVAAVSRDVTETRRAAQQLRRLQRTHAVEHVLELVASRGDRPPPLEDRPPRPEEIDLRHILEEMAELVGLILGPERVPGIARGESVPSIVGDRGDVERLARCLLSASATGPLHLTSEKESVLLRLPVGREGIDEAALRRSVHPLEGEVVWTEDGLEVRLPMATAARRAVAAARRLASTEMHGDGFGADPERLEPQWPFL
jgi:PAS domain S-box-containing protein